MMTEVRSRAQLRTFIRFPASLYGTDPNWTPPLYAGERSAYDATRNPALAGGDSTVVLATRDGRVVGRNLVFTDPAFNDYYNTRTGFFGALETVNDQSVMQELLDHAAGWLRGRGMTRMRGPINPVVENWGFLVEGFDDPAVFLTPYNHPYYGVLAERSGLQKAKDLLAYVADGGYGYRIPERFTRFVDRYASRYPQITVRPIDLSRLREEAETIWRLSNASLADNWGYVPVDRQTMEDMVRRLKPILDPDAVWFVCDRGTPVGFCLGWPDINVILRRIRGRLWPTGFITLMTQRRKLSRYRLFGIGVLPEYHGRGLDTLLYLKLFERLQPRGIRLEANYILEDNPRIRNALEKMKMQLVKRYRVYEMPL